MSGTDFEFLNSHKSTSVFILYKLFNKMSIFWVPNATLCIEGDTDTMESDKYNLELSRKWVKMIYKALLKQGIAKERMWYREYGDKSLLLSNKIPKGRIINRRVEIYIEY